MERLKYLTSPVVAPMPHIRVENMMQWVCHWNIHFIVQERKASGGHALKAKERLRSSSHSRKGPKKSISRKKLRHEKLLTTDEPTVC